MASRFSLNTALCDFDVNLKHGPISYLRIKEISLVSQKGASRSTPGLPGPSLPRLGVLTFWGISVSGCPLAFSVQHGHQLQGLPGQLAEGDSGSAPTPQPE